MGTVILAIDQGTTGSTVALMDTSGVVIASASHEFPQLFPQPGWVEHDPESIWQSVLKGVDKVFNESAVSPADVITIGITNQRETAILWDRETGEALHNAIVWQCRRTTDVCQQLKEAGCESMVRERAGLVLDPYFSASKYRWLIDHAEVTEGDIDLGWVLAGTVDSYLLWRLTGGAVHATDVSNAARTSLMNLETLAWDSSLCDLFGVPMRILPTIMPSSTRFGVTDSVPGLPDGIPVSGIAGDQQAALFGQACFDAGDAKCTFGTGSFILMNTGELPVSSDAGLLTTVAWQLDGSRPSYALEGGAFVCGAAVQWLRDQLGIINAAHEIEALAASVPDAGGVEFVPALTGLGAPHWDPDARGLLSGLTRGSGRGEIARATLDAMALQNADILKVMERESGQSMQSLRVDGGASANNLLMQLQANYLDREIVRPELIETTVAGACFLAGLAEGVWSGLDDIRAAWRVDRKFDVDLDAEDRKLRFTSWNAAIAKTRYNAAS